ncbi:MAG: ABC transporter permease [Ardenticatenaceae bacterium]|nr:ABC transporter permease [Ardenticatenaceae bacterium]MCB8947432.1 ABC transporter permease [Ardenticatenaceae bacterium]
MKIWTIAWKDTTIRFRDRNALILMVLAPLVLSAIIGSAFGGFLDSSDPVPFDAIPVLFINQDMGEMGQQFADILTSDALGDLLAVTEMSDETAAREQVQRGEARAAIVIPADFSEAFGGETAVSPALIQFYADPSATITPNIVRGVVTQIVNGFNSAAISSEVAVEQLSTYAADLGPAMANLDASLSAEMQSRFAEGQPTVITLNDVPVGDMEETADISPFAFFAPSMGILFLMFSMMDGTRSILEEEQGGTLDRLVSTPTSHLEIILGKIGGVFLTGALQFVVFVAASALIFQLNWGHSPLGLAMLTLAVVLSLTSLGALIAAFARNPSQAGILGTVVTLVFAALGGTFVPAQNFPPFLQELSKITVTRWALDGFTDLTIYGLGAADVVLETAVLTGLSILFIALALWQFQRRLAK